MTLRRFVVLCFLLALSVSLFLPAAAQTGTSTPTTAASTQNGTNATATPAPTPVSETGAVDLRVSIGEERVLEGALFERTEQPTLDIEARATDPIRLVAVRQDNERVAEYRPGSLSFEQTFRPVLENERNQVRVIVQTVSGATESLSFNYTYDTRGPYMVFEGGSSTFNSAGRNRVVTDNGSVYEFERNESRSVIPEGLVFVANSDVDFEGTVVDASGLDELDWTHTYYYHDIVTEQTFFYLDDDGNLQQGTLITNEPDNNQTFWQRNVSPPSRVYNIDQPFYLPPATINQIDMVFWDKLGNRRNRDFSVYVDDDEPPSFDLTLKETDREQDLVRPTVPDADLEMIDDNDDGQGSIVSAIEEQSPDTEDDDDGGGGDDDDRVSGGDDTDYDIPGSGNDPYCDDSFADDQEWDSDPVPDEYTRSSGSVVHPIADHDDFDPDVYGEHYCNGEIFYFNNPDWPFPQGGPFNYSQSNGAGSLSNEAMEYETISYNCGGNCGYSVDTIYDPDQEDEDNDQAINVDLEAAPRDSTAKKQIRVTGTVSDNAQLRRVTVRVGWHVEEVTDARGLSSDPSGVNPYRPERNLTGVSPTINRTFGPDYSLPVRDGFSHDPDEDEEDNTISCDEESGDKAMDGHDRIRGVDTGEVGPLGPDNDPGGDVQICDESNQPILLYYEQDVLEPTAARKFNSSFQTVQINETIPLKNRTDKTITNVVEVEAQDFQGHEQRRLALVEKEPLQPAPIISLDPQRTRSTSDGRLNVAGRVFDGLVRTVTVETRKDGSIYDFAEVHNGSTRSDIRIQETLERPQGPTTVVVRAVDIRGTVHTQRLRLDAIRTRTPTETPFQTEPPEESTPEDTVTPPEPDTPIPTPTPTATPASTPSPAANTTTATPGADRGAAFGDNFGFAAVALALVSVAALARRRIV